jgi:hypothetical protein
MGELPFSRFREIDQLTMAQESDRNEIARRRAKE